MANQPANKTELAAITLLQSGNFSLEDVYDLLGSRVIWSGWTSQNQGDTTIVDESILEQEAWDAIAQVLGNKPKLPGIYTDPLPNPIYQVLSQSAIQDPSSAESWILCVYAGDDS